MPSLVMAVADNQYGNLLFFTPELQCIDHCQLLLSEIELELGNNHRVIAELPDFKSCRDGLEGEVIVLKRKQFKATSSPS